MKYHADRGGLVSNIFVVLFFTNTFVIVSFSLTLAHFADGVLGLSLRVVTSMKSAVSNV